MYSPSDLATSHFEDHQHRPEEVRNRKGSHQGASCNNPFPGPLTEAILPGPTPQPLFVFPSRSLLHSCMCDLLLQCTLSLCRALMMASSSLYPSQHRKSALSTLEANMPHSEFRQQQVPSHYHKKSENELHNHVPVMNSTATKHSQQKYD